MVTVATQTLWTLPATDKVENCPTPTGEFAKILFSTTRFFRGTYGISSSPGHSVSSDSHASSSMDTFTGKFTTALIDRYRQEINWSPQMVNSLLRLTQLQPAYTSIESALRTNGSGVYGDPMSSVVAATSIANTAETLYPNNTNPESRILLSLNSNGVERENADVLSPFSSSGIHISECDADGQDEKPDVTSLNSTIGINEESLASLNNESGHNSLSAESALIKQAVSHDTVSRESVSTDVDISISDTPSRQSSSGSDAVTSSTSPNTSREDVARTSQGEDTEMPFASPSSSMRMDTKPDLLQGVYCQVCADKAAGFHCGCFVCEACKKFFIRATKQNNRMYTCSRPHGAEPCVVNKDTRTLCQACRYAKCVEVGMKPPGQSLIETTKIMSLKCKVCDSPASGFHFGTLSCEGCKGFFRRLMKNSKNPQLKCQKGGHCIIDSNSRSLCRACRYNKCIKAGMSPNATRVGRQPNIIRHARIVQNQPGHSSDIKEELMDTDEKENPVEECSQSTSQPVSQTVDPYSVENLNDEALGADSVDSPPNSFTAGDSDFVVSPMTDIVLDLSPFSIHDDTNWFTQIEVLKQLHHEIEEEGKKILRLGPSTIGHLDDANFVSEVFGDFKRWLLCILAPLKKSDGFSNICVEDKVILTRHGLFRALLLSMRAWFKHSDSYMFFFQKGGGADAERLAHLLPELTVAKFFFQDVRYQYPDLDMDQEEMALVFFMNIINKDHLEEMREPEFITTLYKKYETLLIKHVTTKYNNPTERLKTIMGLLRYLCRAGIRHGNSAKSMCRNNSKYRSAADGVVVDTYSEVYKDYPNETQV